MYKSRLYNNTKVAYKIKLIIFMILMVHLEIREAGLRILGGRNALKDEFPFAVRFEFQLTRTKDGKNYFEYIPFCTGAAVTPSWMLTAAHCGDDEFAKIRLFPFELMITKPRKFVRYNSYFPKVLGQLSLVINVLIHPGFFSNDISRTKYDIALFKTENTIVSHYGKISAIDYTSIVGHEVLSLGLGGTNATDKEKPLQVLEGMLIKCDLREGNFYGMLCVVPRCGHEATTCSGDSGGPILHASGIVGVNSGSFGNCRATGYELYPGYASAGIAMISPVFDWISNIIANKSVLI